MKFKLITISGVLLVSATFGLSLAQAEQGAYVPVAPQLQGWKLAEVDKILEKKAYLEKLEQKYKSSSAKTTQSKQPNKIGSKMEHESGAQENESLQTSKGGEWVACPVQRVRTEIVTQLPSEWWQTPQNGDLKNTMVSNVGGKPTLSCRYWAYGGLVSVMRLVPNGLNHCVAKRGGFSCS